MPIKKNNWGDFWYPDYGNIRPRVLIADPPWQFGDSLPGAGRGASKNYDTLNHHQLAQYPIPNMQQGALLLLWRVAAMPTEALYVCSGWGFTPKAEIVWRKLTKNGKPFFGMGRTVRASHETCIVATRGSYKPASRSVRSVFEAPVPVDDQGRYIHSAKPPEFYALVRELCGPVSIAELFSRTERPGIRGFGDQYPDTA